MNQPPTHRVTVLFEGHVQGVGFRWTAARAARQVGVTGWVRNERDGTVQLVAEAVSDQLDRFLDSIRRDMEGHIRNERIERSSATGEFSSFEIRR